MHQRKFIQPLVRKTLKHLDIYDEGQYYENIYSEEKLIKKCSYDLDGDTWEIRNQKRGCQDDFKYIYQQPGIPIFNDQHEELQQYQEQNEEKSEELQQQFISRARSRSYDQTSFSDLKIMSLDLGEGRVLKVDEINYLEDIQQDSQESRKQRRKKNQDSGLRKKIQKFEFN